MKLFIKNMDGPESKTWLKTQLNDLGIAHEKEIQLGEIALTTVISPQKLQDLKTRLEDKGLCIIYDRKQVLSEQVKYIVQEMLNCKEAPQQNYSTYISERLHLNYTYLANIFSETQGITIEHFIINQKIEKAKDLLLYNDYSISQVADMLNYSSIGHLSNQFKKVTGVSPSEFKKQMQSR